MSSVTYDNSTSGITTGNPFVSFTHTIGGEAKMYCLVSASIINQVSENFPQSCTVGGQSASLLEFASVPGGNSNGLQVWGLANPPSGAQTITLTGPGGVMNIFYSAYTYYNVNFVDNHGSVANTAASGGNVNLTLSSILNNCFMWGVTSFFAASAGGSNVSLIGSNNSQSQNSANTRILAAADWGIVSTPTSETISVTSTTGGQITAMAIVSLAGNQVYTISSTTGAYSLVGRTISFSLFKQYFLVAVRGTYSLTGRIANLIYTRSPWTNVPKASGTIYTKVPKASFASTNSIQAGNPIGLLLALTYSNSASVLSAGWTKVSKAAGTGWTKITKA